MSGDQVKVPEGKLQQHFEEQLQFLQASADSYDKDFYGESKRMALTIRVLLHEKGMSHSLLKQIRGEFGNFLSTTLVEYDPQSASTHSGLTMIAHRGSESRFVAMLDDMHHSANWIPFDEWWNQIIIADQGKNTFSRKDLILTVADQDGGAHVDPEINEFYYRLSNENAMEWKAHVDGKDYSVPGAEDASIRQIAHEVLKTLIPEYSKKPNHKADMYSGGVLLKKGTQVPVKPDIPKVGRNDPCPCGCGKKYKYCHGR